MMQDASRLNIEFSFEQKLMMENEHQRDIINLR